MPKEPVPPVESAAVSAEKPIHPGHQVRLRSLHHQMKMVPHQAIRMHLPTGLGTPLPERVQKAPTIPLVEENRFSPVAPVHRVVNRARILDSQLARQYNREP